jgi:hypothetical protein
MQEKNGDNLPVNRMPLFFRNVRLVWDSHKIFAPKLTILREFIFTYGVTTGHRPSQASSAKKNRKGQGWPVQSINRRLQRYGKLGTLPECHSQIFIENMRFQLLWCNQIRDNQIRPVRVQRPRIHLIHIWAVRTAEGSLDYRCADRNKVGEFRGEIGAIR